MQANKYDIPQLRLLLIDDNENDYIVTQDVVEQIAHMNIEMEWADTYQAGLQVLATQVHDVCLIDYRLGPQSGIDLLRAARAQGCRIPMIILTGLGTREIDMEAMQEGAADFIVKDNLRPDLLEHSLRYTMERQRASNQLKANEEKFRAMYENAPLGMVMARKGGEIIQVNQAFSDLGGYQSSELASRNFYEFLDTSDPKNTEEVPMLFGHDHRKPVEVLYLHKSGHRVPILLGSAQFQNSQGNEHVWLFVEDITERKKQQEQLIQTSQINAVGELASNVKQELNQHLQTIQKKLQEVLTQEQNQLSTPGRRELEIALQQCDSLSRLTGGLLARQKQQMVARWNVDKTMNQLRLRILREPGAGRFRKYIASPEGRAEFAARLQESARRSSVQEGLEEIRMWLRNSTPPLLLSTAQLPVWKRIQSTLREALEQLRDSMMSAMNETNAPQLSMSGQDYPAPTPRSVTTPQPVTRHPVTNPGPSPAPASRPSQEPPAPTSRSSSTWTSFRSESATPKPTPTPKPAPTPTSSSSFRSVSQGTISSDEIIPPPASQGPLQRASSVSNVVPPKMRVSSEQNAIPSWSYSSSDSNPNTVRTPSTSAVRQPTQSPSSAHSSVPKTPQTNTNRKVNVPSEEEIPLSKELEDLLEFMLGQYKKMRLQQWINRKSFTAYLRRHLYRYQEYNTIPLDPLWETVQKIPGVNPIVIRKFFRALAAETPDIPLELPPLLQDESSYRSGNPKG